LRRFGERGVVGGSTVSSRTELSSFSSFTSIELVFLFLFLIDSTPSIKGTEVLLVSIDVSLSIGIWLTTTSDTLISKDVLLLSTAFCDTLIIDTSDILLLLFLVCIAKIF
jgi:hypothetical protein